MASLIASITATPAGHIVALRRDGSLARQVRVEGISGSYPTKWTDVPLDGIAGKIVQAIVRDTGSTADSITVLTSAGELYETFREFHDKEGTIRWRAVDLTVREV